MHLFDKSVNFLGGHAHRRRAPAARRRGRLRDQVPGRRPGRRCATSATARCPRASSTSRMNLAALWKLPVDLHLREQPLRDGHRASTARSPQTEIWRFGRAYGMACRGGRRHGRARRPRRGGAGGRAGAARARRPTLIEARTYRFRGHSMRDPAGAVYRTKDEVEREKLRDPIALFRERCAAGRVLVRGRRPQASRRTSTTCVGRGGGLRRGLARAARCPSCSPTSTRTS